MNYKTIEYKSVDYKGICGYSGSPSSTNAHLDVIDYETFIAFQILLESIKNCVVNRVYLKIKPNGNQNAVLYAKSIEGVNLDKELIISRASYSAEEDRYIFDITPAFENDTFDIKILDILSEYTFEFHNMFNTEENRPVLVVEYIEQCEILTKEKNIGLTLSDGITGSSGVSGGVATITKPLASYGGEAMPLDLSINYCSAYYDQVNFNGMPKGWKLNYHQKVEYDNESNYFKYTDASHCIHKFVSAIGSSNTYFDVAGTGLILIRNTDNTCKIIDGYNNELVFNINGLLTKISKKCNTNEIKTSIIYDSSNRISAICDGMGRYIYVNYYTDYVYIFGNGIKPITLKFDTNNYLTSVYEKNGRKTEFEYDTNKYITSILNVDNEKIVFTYDNCGRVTNIKQNVNITEEVLVEETQFIYHVSSTLTKDRMGNYVQYMFDAERNIVQVIQDDKNIKKLTRNGLSQITSTLNKESYRAYEDANISAQKFHSLSVSTENSQGSFSIEENKMYALVFKYTINQIDETGKAFGVKITVNQSGSSSYEHYVLASSLGPKYEVVYFVSQNTNYVDFEFLLEGNLVKMNIEDIKLYQCKEQKTKICIDQNVESEFTKTIGGKTWYELDDNYTSAHYGDNQIQLPHKMYLEDLLENQKNLNMSSMNQYIWYNKKRGLVVTNKAYIKVGNSYPDLSNINIGIVGETDNYTALSYTDYSDTSSFRTEYTIYKPDDTEYVTKRKLNSNFLVTYEKDYNDIEVTYLFDSYGKLLQEEVSNENVSIKTVKSYTYTNNYLTKEMVVINGATKSTTYEYDTNNGYLLKTTYPDGQVITHEYDQNSKDLIKVSNGTSVNEIIYNNDLITSLKGSGNGHVFEYDKFNMLSKVKHSDDVSLEIETVFDNFEITKTYNLKSTPNTYLKYHYDKYGHLFLIENSSDNTTFSTSKKIFYSDKDVEKIDDITLPNVTALNKSSSSKLRKVVDDEIDNTKRLYYDDEGKLTKVTNTCLEYCHYPAQTVYGYDNNDRVNAVEQIIGINDLLTTLEYQNDLDNEISKATAVLDYGYTTTSSSTEVTTYGEMRCELSSSKDALGRILTKNCKYTTSNMLNTSYTYQTSSNNTNNLITKEQHTGLSTKAYTYTYDDVGRIASISDGTYTTSYAYDTLGRLIRENNQRLNKTSVYTYDNNGNITLKEEGDYTLGTPDLDRFEQFDYSTTTPDLLICHHGQDFVYSSGLPTSDGSLSYTWIRGGLLSKLSYSTTKYLDYLYDVDGRRIEKSYTLNGTVTTHTYRLDGNKIVYEKIASGTTSYELIYLYVMDELVGFVYNGENYYYQKNFRNDIIAIYNSSGTVVAKYEYDAWGNHKVYNGSDVLNTSTTFVGNVNPFRYRGYYYDVETGLFMVGHRYYNPEWGRWLSPDDIEYLDPHSINGLNLYAYCSNDPINYVDYDGHFAISSFNRYKNFSRYIPVVTIPIVKVPSKPLYFSVGLVTPENYDMPSWMTIYGFYARGSLGLNYDVIDGNYSIASLSFGVIDAIFKLGESPISIGVGALNVNASIGTGFSASAEIVSASIDFEISDSFSIGLKGYVGAGISIDFSNGIEVSYGAPFGFSLEFNFDWW